MNTIHRNTALLLVAALAAGGAARAETGGDAQHGHDAAAATSAAAGSAGEKQAGHSHSKCELHGGQVSMTTAHHFETVFARDGLFVYAYSEQQLPMPAEKLTGKVTLKYKDGATKEVPLQVRAPKAEERAAYYCPMHPDQQAAKAAKCPKCGMNLVPQSALWGAVDLTRVAPNALKATIEVQGMEGKEPKASFTEPFHGFAAASMESPEHHEEHGHEQAKQSGDEHKEHQGH